MRSCWVMKCRVIYATDTRNTITQTQLNGLVASDSKLRAKKGFKQMASPKSPAPAAPEAHRRLSPLQTRLPSPPFRPTRCHGYRLLSKRTADCVLTLCLNSSPWQCEPRPVAGAWTATLWAGRSAPRCLPGRPTQVKPAATSSSPMAERRH